jgi:hypothetical protein
MSKIEDVIIKWYEETKEKISNATEWENCSLMCEKIIKDLQVKQAQALTDKFYIIERDGFFDVLYETIYSEWALTFDDCFRTKLPQPQVRRNITQAIIQLLEGER